MNSVRAPLAPSLHLPIPPWAEALLGHRLRELDRSLPRSASHGSLTSQRHRGSCGTHVDLRRPLSKRHGPPTGDGPAVARLTCAGHLSVLHPMCHRHNMPLRSLFHPECTFGMAPALRKRDHCHHCHGRNKMTRLCLSRSERSGGCLV